MSIGILSGRWHHHEMNDDAMTETPIDREISNELARIRAREEVIPFLGEILTVAEVEFRPLPEEMRTIIQSSADFVSIAPGADSTWLNLEAEDAGRRRCRSGS